MSDWFGTPLDVIVRIAATTAMFYAATFVLLRLAGRRTLAEFSAFDVVITIAIGSIIATTTVSSQPVFLQGLTALVVLIVLQVGIGFVRQRVPWTRRILDFSVEEIVRDGRFSMRRGPLGAQLTDDELRSKLREKGYFDLDSVQLVILEPTGQVSVLPKE